MRISYQYKIRKRVISGGELLPYLNLKTELKKTNITNEEIAHVLRLRTEDVLDKLEGSGRFTIGEAMLLKKRYFSRMPLEYLFVHTASKP